MKRLLLTAGLALPHLLFAQAPSGVSLDRDRPLVGETVTVVVNFEAASRWCGLHVDLGDGDVRDVRVQDFPLTLTKQYASTGRYVIRAAGRALPRGLLSVLPCTGRARTAALEVVEVRRDELLSSRQLDVPGNGVLFKEIKKKYRGWYKNEDASQRNGEIDFERAYGRPDHEGRRERARRTSLPRRQPAHRGPRSDAAASSGSLPAPAQGPAPAPAPAPTNGKPRDGSLKVF